MHVIDPSILAITGSGAAGAALFYLFALMAGGSAIAVVVSRNIVRTAVYLLFTLTGVAGLYFLLNAEFLAAVQLVVYAGGTLILIIFGVMLTSKSPFARFEPKLVEVIIALSLASVLLAAIGVAILRTSTNVSGTQPVFANQPLVTNDHYPINQLGEALLGDYLLPFELASVLLLVVMIGAAFLAKGRRRPHEESGQSAASRQARSWS